MVEAQLDSIQYKVGVQVHISHATCTSQHSSHLETTTANQNTHLHLAHDPKEATHG
jgi:hypothetical protein